MKKFAVLALSAIMLITAVLPMAVSADNKGIDSNLVLHYDFDEKNFDSQTGYVKDVAPSGVSKDDIYLCSTADSDGNPLSYVKEGKAHVASAINNYMRIMLGSYKDNETDAEPKMHGADVLNCANNGQITLFSTFSISGAPQAWATFLDVHNVARCILGGRANNTAAFSTPIFRVTKNAYYNGNTEIKVKNADIYHDTDVVSMAISFNYDKATKKLVASLFLSFDGGAHYQEFPALFENIEAEDFIAGCTYIMLGKTAAGNQYKKVDHGTSTDFYDFKIYNKALNADEVKLIDTGIEKKADETTVPETEAPAVPEETTAEETTAAATTKEEAKTTAAKTTAAATTEEAKKGCGSAIGMGSVAIASSVALAGIIAKKKKRK